MRDNALDSGFVNHGTQMEAPMHQTTLDLVPTREDILDMPDAALEALIAAHIGDPILDPTPVVNRFDALRAKYVSSKGNRLPLRAIPEDVLRREFWNYGEPFMVVDIDAPVDLPDVATMTLAQLEATQGDEPPSESYLAWRDGHGGALSLQGYASLEGSIGEILSGSMDEIPVHDDPVTADAAMTDRDWERHAARFRSPVFLGAYEHPRKAARIHMEQREYHSSRPITIRVLVDDAGRTTLRRGESHYAHWNGRTRTHVAGARFDPTTAEFNHAVVAVANMLAHARCKHLTELDATAQLVTRGCTPLDLTDGAHVIATLSTGYGRNGLGRTLAAIDATIARQAREAVDPVDDPIFYSNVRTLELVRGTHAFAPFRTTHLCSNCHNTGVYRKGDFAGACFYCTVPPRTIEVRTGGFLTVPGHILRTTKFVAYRETTVVAHHLSDNYSRFTDPTHRFGSYYAPPTSFENDPLVPHMEDANADGTFYGLSDRSVERSLGHGDDCFSDYTGALTCRGRACNQAHPLSDLTTGLDAMLEWLA